MKKCSLFFLIFFSIQLYSQTLVQTVDLPSGTYWNQAYGLVFADGKYWISSGSSTAGVANGKIIAVTDQGQPVDTVDASLNYPAIRYSQGLGWDGNHFWYVERKTARTDLYKFDMNGIVSDSILSTTLFGGSWYMGGAAWDGTGLWVSVYFPNANVALYKINTTTKTIVDTIQITWLHPTQPPLQPQGITVKGDTLFFVNDGFEGIERIFAFDLNTKDTLFSFQLPEQPGVRQNPRGLAWDGSHFWLLAEPVGATSGRQLFKYDLSGTGTPGMNLLTTSINFGNVQIDSTRNSAIYIQNYGTANLVIDSTFVSNPAFNLLETFPLTIAPGEMKGIPVTFTPVANVTYNDSILFYNNDPTSQYGKTTVTGSGIYTEPYISFSPSVVNFGNKRVLSTSYIEVTMSNLGSYVLTVDSITVSNPEFYFEKVTLPVVIDSVQSSSFRIWFYPPATGAYTDTIVVYSNASNMLRQAVHRIPVMANSVTFDPALGNIVWQGQIPPNPVTSFQNYTVRAMHMIEDITGDGIEDLIVSSQNYWTIAFNGNSSVSGDILWKFSSYGSNINAGAVEWVQCLQLSSDLNGDGVQDVVIGTAGGNEFVYAINGLTGAKIWEHGDSINYNNGDIMGVDVSRDWNNDGIPDVLVSASGNESTGQGRFSVILLNGVTGNVIWTINQAAQQKLKYMVAATDFGGAVGSRVGSNNEVIGFDKFGNIAWSFPTTGTPWTVREIPDIGGGPGSDLIVGTTSGWVYAITGDAGIQLWSRQIGSVFIEDLRIIPDINNSGFPNILVSGINPNVYVLEGSNGNIVWQQNTGGNILGIGVLGDMNANTLPEVGTASLNNLIHVFDSRFGTEMFTFAFGGGGNSTAAEHIIMIGDVDQNYSNEFAAGSRDGRVIAFSGGTDVIPVELSLFNASVNGNDVLLRWTTASELNNSGFAIERRLGDESFTQIGFVQGKGTSTEMTEYKYLDKELQYGSYSYRLKQIDFDGTTSYSDIIEVEVGLPINYSLEQNYPNPFNPSTTIKYSLPLNGNVKLSVFNTLGEEVAVLVNELAEAGYYTIEWNGTNNHNVKLPSGVYIYRLEAGNFTSAKKLVILK